MGLLTTFGIARIIYSSQVMQALRMQARAIALIVASSIPMPCSAWSYDADKDKMTGKVIREAAVISENDVVLPWPHGEVYGRLVVRNHPRFGKDVIFSVQNGQMPCHRYSPCKVLVKFDAGKPLTFNAVGPSDGSSNYIFIDGYDRFTRSLEKSKTVLFEVEFWKSGNKQFTFDTEGFSTKQLDATKPF